jgi:cell wall-associated NlpC family hydrolase
MYSDLLYKGVICLKIRKKAALCAILAAIMLSTSVPKIKLTAFANSTVSEIEALGKAVSLYEQLTSSEVEIPNEINETGLDKNMLKSVVLGYVNFEDTEDVMQEGSIRKQDFVTVLYKTIVSYNDSYAIYEDEANAILNECYDNAYIDEENRIAYAFMMKQGIIRENFGSQPNKELTKEECDSLVSTVYDYFSGKVSIDIGGKTVTIGAKTDTIIDRFGQPNRIDKTEYGFDWYVYNSNYSEFCMVGVEADRVCAVFTNGRNFEVDGIKSGDDYSKTDKYSDNSSFSFYMDSEGHVDSVLYNPADRGNESDASVKRSKALILLDMINSNRSKNLKPIYVEDSQLSAQAWLAAVDSESSDQDDENLIKQSGYDVFTVYKQLVENDSDIITQDAKYSTPIGISSVSNEDGNIEMSITSDTSRMAAQKKSETVEIPEADYSVSGVDCVTTPVLVSPVTENEYNDGDDIVISLEMQAATEYHVEVFDVENDEYAVNAYIVTDKTDITLPSKLFEDGKDYRVRVSSVTEDGEELSADEVLVSYGSTYEGGVTIITPYNEGVTDDDYIDIVWQSDKYHDFNVELYDEENNLIVSKTVSDEYEAIIHGVDPGKYFVTVTALRRGTKVAKSQDCVTLEVQAAEAVINEIILDKNDKYYFVYDDEELGLLYFYDEELVDVEENGQTVQKKKIIQKQVKATKGYRQLAKYRTKIEYTTGDPVIMQHTLSQDTTKGNEIVAEASKYLGVPYVWGGTTPNGFDCSGLVQYVCSSLGISVNRVAEDQFNNGTPVSKDELQPGDLIFFERNGYIHHVGIYVGNNMMIHAPRTGDVVKYQSIDTDYYRSEYAGARRVY